MRTLIMLILSCLPLLGATTYPVLTDNANRTFTGGATNMALLSGTNVFTGTNTFTAAKFFPANRITFRTLYVAPTNIYISSVSTAANKTNNGDFSSLTSVYSGTLPALLSSNSIIYFQYQCVKPEASTTSADLVVFLGSNTNYVGTGANALCTAGPTHNTIGVVNSIFANCDSFTLQTTGSQLSAGPFIAGPTNYTDTSSPFSIFIAGRTATSHTNLWIYGFKIIEAVGN